MKFEYSPQITLGNLTQIATIILGAISIYVGLRETDIQHEALIKTHTVQIDEIKINSKQERAEIKLDIKEINNNVKSLDNKLTEYTMRQKDRETPNAKRNP